MPTQAFNYPYSNYTIKWASSNWEVEQAQALRRRVFCHEQGLFDGDDHDSIDDYAQSLIAIANHGCWHDKVVGTVRIHHQRNNIWWGSRLAVDTEFRTHRGIGSALIKLAVSSANGLGCQQFLAQVQKQNESLFKRLNWQSLYQLEVQNRPHVMMQAELEKFPPIKNPSTGFIVRENLDDYNLQIAPALLQSYCEPLMSSRITPAHASL